MEREIQRIDIKRPLTIAERTFLLGAKIYAQFLELPQPVRNYLVDEIFESYLRREKRSLYRDARYLLMDQTLKVQGADFIPKEGPLLVIANHWSDGPAKGSWSLPAINKEVEKAIPNSDVKWIAGGGARLPVNAIGIPFSDRLFRGIVGDVYGQYVVGDSGSLLGGLKIVRSFKRDGLIGLFPEAHFSKELKEGDSKAGFVTAMMATARPDGQVLPVGIYSEYKKLFLNFGRPFSMREVFERTVPLPSDKKMKMEITKRNANFLMQKIDVLLPAQYRLKKA